MWEKVKLGFPPDEADIGSRSEKARCNLVQGKQLRPICEETIASDGSDLDQIKEE